MKTVTIGLSGREQSGARFARAMRGEKMGSYIGFQNPGLLFKTLTIKRWDILKALTGKEPVSIRETARLVERDVKAVHGDITTLLNVGILQRTKDNKIEFPFDQIYVDFILSDAV